MYVDSIGKWNLFYLLPTTYFSPWPVLTIYFFPASKILVHLATYSKVYFLYLSAIRSHYEGRANPVSDSLIPHNLFIFYINSLFSSSIFLIFSE